MAWADWSSQIRDGSSQTTFIYLFIKTKMFDKNLEKLG